MTRFGDIVGQSGAIELLGRMLDSGRIPHAMLFHGPEGVGKATTARAFASCLLCVGTDAAPCGSCPSCSALASRAHPDLMEIGLQAKKERSSRTKAEETAGPEELKKQIVVDQIRDLSRMASQTPRIAGRRVFLIDPADTMNPPAQNALLKTLEEPPGRAVLILIAARPHVLLPTVRSRSFALGFAALRSADLADVLRRRGVPADEATRRAALAEGRPGLAMGLDVDALSERRDDVLCMLEALAPPRSSLDRLPAMAAALAGKTESTLIDGLDILLGLLRDATRCAAQAPPHGLLNGDLVSRLEPLGRRLGQRRSAELVRGVERCRGDLRLNLNRSLVAEAVLAAVAGGPVP